MPLTVDIAILNSGPTANRLNGLIKPKVGRSPFKNLT